MELTGCGSARGGGGAALAFLPAGVLRKAGVETCRYTSPWYAVLHCAVPDAHMCPSSSQPHANFTASSMRF